MEHFRRHGFDRYVGADPVRDTDPLGVDIPGIGSRVRPGGNGVAPPFTVTAGRVYLPGGVYFLRARSADHVERLKLTVLR